MMKITIRAFRNAAGVCDTSGGLGAVLSCRLKGCAEVAVVPPEADLPSAHNPCTSTRQGSAKRHVADTAQKRRSLQSRVVARRRDPGAALRFPPATLAQALSLKWQPPIRPGGHAWMPGRRRLVVFMLTALVSARPALAVGDVDVLWLDGKQATATWRGAESPGTLRLDFDGTPRDVSLSDLQRIRVRPVDRDLPEFTEFLIAGGGKIRGQLGERKPGAVVVRRTGGESLTVPFDLLVAVLFVRPAIAPAQRALWDRAVAGRLPGEDTLVTSKGDHSKLLHGRLVDLGRDGGTFEFGGQERSFSLDKVYGVVLAEGVGRPAPPPARVHLTDGTVFPGTIATADAQSLVLQTSLGTKVSLSLNQIARIEFLSDRITYLSQLTPTEQETKGIIHEPWPVRLDQTVNARPIRLLGQSFQRGIGCHSYTRLAYTLDKAYETFVSMIGIDDDVRPRGSVVFQVQGDGTVLFDSGTLTGRSDARAISVDVREVTTLSLIVDFADGLDLSDHAVWAGARLIAPTRPSGGKR